MSVQYICNEQRQRIITFPSRALSLATRSGKIRSSAILMNPMKGETSKQAQARLDLRSLIEPRECV